MKLRSIIAAFVCLFSLNTFAEEKAAKEDMTPPPMEGPLTVSEIPPIVSAPEGAPSANMPQTP